MRGSEGGLLLRTGRSRRCERRVLKLNNLNAVLMKGEEENRRIAGFGGAALQKGSPVDSQTASFVLRGALLLRGDISRLHIPGEKHKSWPPRNFLPTAILVGNVVQHV